MKEAREEAEKPETLKLAAVFEKDPAGRIAAYGDLNRCYGIQDAVKRSLSRAQLRTGKILCDTGTVVDFG